MKYFQFIFRCTKRSDCKIAHCARIKTTAVEPDDLDIRQGKLLPS